MDHPNPATTGRDLFLIVALSLVALAPSLFTRGPWNPDEPRYTQVAIEMVETGQYLVPHLNGELYPDKPPLVFWASAGLYALGFGFASARVVSLLAAVGTVVVTGQIGRRLYGREVGLIAALATLTSGLFLFICDYGVLDPPLTFFVVASIYCALRALEGTGRRGAWWLGAYGAMGLGVLVKGPVALVVPALAVAGYAMTHRRDVRAGGWWHLAGAGLLLAVVAAWVVPACLVGGEAYAENLLGQPWKRVARSPSHRKPPWFYLAYSPGLFFPWFFVLVLAAVWSARSARRKDGPGVGLEFLWFAAAFLFFSAVSGKRARYLLPVVPAAGLLCARYVWAVARGEAACSRWHKWLWGASFVLLGVLGAALAAAPLATEPLARVLKLDVEQEALLSEALAPEHMAMAIGGGVAVLVVCVHALRLPASARGETRRALALVCGVLALSLAVAVAARPVLNQFKSAAPFVDEARPYLDQADVVYLYSSDFSGVYNLHTGRIRMEVLAYDKWRLRRRLYRPGRVAVIADKDGDKTIAEMTRHLRRPNVHVPVRRWVGDDLMFLIVNWDEGPRREAKP